MREIKFRIWNKIKKEFILPKFIEDVVFSSSESTIECSNDDKGDYVFQQYTGLKDRNGKEIYEGDIIKFMGKWDEDGKVLAPDYLPYQVVWFMGGLYALLISANHCRSYHVHNEVLGVGHTESEVFGNIFENPKLCQ